MLGVKKSDVMFFFSLEIFRVSFENFFKDGEREITEFVGFGVEVLTHSFVKFVIDNSTAMFGDSDLDLMITFANIATSGV